MKESDPKTASSGREVDYLDVEVLPRTGKQRAELVIPTRSSN